MKVIPLRELSSFTHSLKVATILGFSDIQLLYRRSSLGPLWMTLTLGAQILVIGLLFSSLFSQEATSYLLYFGSGLMLWIFCTNSINDGANSLVSSATLVKQIALPKSMHVFRVVVKNLLILCHNSLVLIPLYFLSPSSLTLMILTALPSIILVAMLLATVAYSLSVVSARYRDLPPIISGAIVIAFYATPILWKPEQFEGSIIFTLIHFNPFFHVVEIVRNPLLGEPPSIFSLGVVSSLFLVGLIVAFFVKNRLEKFVPFWV